MSVGANDEVPAEPAEASTPHRHWPPHDEHVLLEPQEDRWAWRRKIRSNPHQLRVYRFAVAVAGLLLIGLGVVTGPLPGPGGIPLVLAGLAVWASEFRWAHRLMLKFKHGLHVFRTWSRPKQTLAWVVFFACCGLFGYTYLLVLGLPTWMPNQVDVLLQRLPGL